MFIKHLRNLLILFGSVKITNTTNSDTGKWQYSSYGIGFDLKGEFTHPDGSFGRNVIIFGADLSNTKHSNNKTKNILVLRREFVQKINYTTIYAEKMYSPNFTVDDKKFCLNLHYNVTIVTYLLMVNKSLNSNTQCV